MELYTIHIHVSLAHNTMHFNLEGELHRILPLVEKLKLQKNTNNKKTKTKAKATKQTKTKEKTKKKRKEI